jgi:hypothetical protein
MKYDMILAYLPALKDHGRDFAYYGAPKDDTYEEYAAEDEEGNQLVIAGECEEFCETCAFILRDEVDPEEVLSRRPVEGMKIEDMDEELTAAYLLDLIDSLAENDRFLDALQDGTVVRLVEKLGAFNR